MEAGYLDSTDALSLLGLPHALIVIGDGAGLELGQLFARFGGRVTLVETLPHIAAAEEPEPSEALARYLTAERLTVLTGARMGRVDRSSDGYRVPVDVNGRKQTLVAEQLIIATGRRGGRRHLGNKALVVIAAQVDGKRIGRVRMRRIPDASSRSLLSFLNEAVEPGSTAVVTDGWEGYQGLKERGYQHQSRVISGSGRRPRRSCRGCTGWPRCSNGGFWAHIKGRSREIIWTTTSTSSRFDSTAGHRSAEESSSSGWWSKQQL